MSQENVEIVRRVLEAYSRGDDPSEAVADLDPDVVWNPIEEASVQGIEAVLAYIERWEEPWDEYFMEPEEFVDAGDRVVVTVHFGGRGRHSGAEVDQRLYEVYTVREGKIVRMDEFGERSAALEAVGLSE